MTQSVPMILEGGQSMANCITFRPMPLSPPHAAGLDRAFVIAWYRRNRERSREIFDLLVDDAYYSQPIALRHPIVFYEGHLPGFSFNALVKNALGGQSIDPRLEALFARGIDPHESLGGSSRQSSVASRQSEVASRQSEVVSRQSEVVSRQSEVVSLQSDVTSLQSDVTSFPSAVTSPQSRWPSRREVRAFADEADRRVLDALAHAPLDQPGHPLLDRGEAVFTILEHEAMHQETLLYMWHRLPFDQKRRPSAYSPRAEGRVPVQEWIDVPAGRATLGVDRGSIPFGWDNEHPSSIAEVGAFAIDRHDVTNASFLEFVDAGGYEDEQWWRPEDWQWVKGEQVTHPLFWERVGRAWHWRGMFELIPLPLAWPAYVSQAEASAFARWRGARLPTEAEFQRAAFGSPSGERVHPWGHEEPASNHGVFDFSSWDPEPAGSHRTGASAWGVEDLVGNGWEWTSTPFAPFPGFQAMRSYPEYSADFFDGDHFVMKGASPATARELLRPTFRNWFRARYPYVYAAFRCVTTNR
jgi:ergothioneine biosynthesis protein EgtB